MKKIFASLFLCFCFMQTLISSDIYHHDIKSSPHPTIYIWEEQSISPFNEMIASWNLPRPQKGVLQIYLSVKTVKKGWSPYILYAEWSANGHKTFSGKCKDFSVEIVHNILKTSTDNSAVGFRIKIIATKRASINYDKSHLHASTLSTQVFSSFEKIPYSILLPLSLISQIKSYCDYSHHLYPPNTNDSLLDIYGNWVVNTTQAFQESNLFQFWVTKLSGLHDVINNLQKNMPVLINVPKPLNENTSYYSSGNWLVIIGYNHKTNTFLCLDPSFMSNTPYPSYYTADEIQEAWGKRDYIAYLFRKK